jgi:hypothetical protein
LAGVAVAVRQSHPGRALGVGPNPVGAATDLDEDGLLAGIRSGHHMGVTQDPVNGDLPEGRVVSRGPQRVEGAGLTAPDTVVILEV